MHVNHRVKYPFIFVFLKARNKQLSQVSWKALHIITTHPSHYYKVILMVKSIPSTWGKISTLLKLLMLQEMNSHQVAWWWHIIHQYSWTKHIHALLNKHNFIQHTKDFYSRNYQQAKEKYMKMLLAIYNHLLSRRRPI